VKLRFQEKLSILEISDSLVNKINRQKGSRVDLDKKFIVKKIKAEAAICFTSLNSLAESEWSIKKRSRNSAVFAVK